MTFSLALDSKTRWELAAGAALLAALGFYLAYPDKIFVLDGVFYGLAIEKHVVSLRAALLNPRHLLFLSALMLLRDALSAIGLTLDGYTLIQRVNACAGALGLWIFYRLIARISKDRAMAAITTTLLGASYGYWSRATEGQVYMLMTLGAICVLAAAINLFEKPSPLRAFSLTAIWLISFLFHSANAALVPAVAAALCLATPSRRHRTFLVPSAVMVLAAALVVFQILNIHTSEELLRYLAIDFGGPRLAEKVPNWSALIVSFFHGGGAGIKTLLEQSLDCLFSSLLICHLPLPMKAAAGALMAAGGAAVAALAWRRLDTIQRRAATIFAVAGLGMASLSTFWPGGIFFWTFPLAALMALTSLCGAKLLEDANNRHRRRILGAAAGMALAAGAWNLHAGIRPQSRIENNAGHARALFVRDHTLATSWVVISGLGFGNSKVYLTQFARRSNRALEYFLDSGPKALALAKFKAFLQDAVAHGLPLYALSDLIDDPAVAKNIRSLWGVTPEEVKACFGSGEFRLISTYDANLKLYLFIPDDRRELLFSGLTFNVLDMNDLEHIREASSVMRRLAAEMTPAQRRRTAAILKESRYGALTSLAGMSPYLDASTRPQAEAYAQGFMKSPGPQSRDLIQAIERLLAAQ